MEKELEFFLPEEAKTVPGQLVWIGELLPYLEDSKKQNMDNLSHYLKHLIHTKFPVITNPKEEVKFGDDPHSGGRSCGDDFRTQTIIGKLAAQLTQIAFATYTKNFQMAEEILKACTLSLEDFSNNLEESSAADIRAVKYCIQASNRQLKYLEEHLEATGSVAVAEEILMDDKQKLIAAWEGFDKPENKRFLATIMFFKGCLGVNLQINRDKVVELFKMAAELDGESYLWNHYAFASLRRKRWTASDYFGRKPTAEEINFCEKAYQLCPNDFIIMLDYALLLKDRLWFDKNLSRDKDLWTKCIAAFEDALAACKTSDVGNVQQRAEELTIYLAEGLLFGNNDELDRERGRELLEGCEEGTKVCHKLGKMYQGVRVHGALVYTDFDKAEKFYLRALELCPDNFSCLMEYLRFLQDKRKDYRKMISLIDSSLENHNKKDHWSVALLVQRGCAMWMDLDGQQNKREACQCWLDALIKFPTLNDNVHVGLKTFIFQQQKQNKNIFLEVLQELEKIVEDDLNEGAETRRQVKVLMGKLVKTFSISTYYSSPARRGSGQRQSTATATSSNSDKGIFNKSSK